MAVFAFYHQNPDPGVVSGDGAFFYFVATRLPTPIPGLFMAAMLAAILSTLDSGMNSMATVYLKEIHQLYVNRSLSGLREVAVARWATLGVGGISIAFRARPGVLRQVAGASAAGNRYVFAIWRVTLARRFSFAVALQSGPKRC